MPVHSEPAATRLSVAIALSATLLCPAWTTAAEGDHDCDADNCAESQTDAAAKKRSHEEKIIQARIKEITSRRT